MMIAQPQLPHLVLDVREQPEHRLGEHCEVGRSRLSRSSFSPVALSWSWSLGPTKSVNL